MQREAQGSCPATGTKKKAALALEVKGQREWLLQQQLWYIKLYSIGGFWKCFFYIMEHPLHVAKLVFQKLWREGQSVAVLWATRTLRYEVRKNVPLVLMDCALLTSCCRDLRADSDLSYHNKPELQPVRKRDESVLLSSDGFFIPWQHITKEGGHLVHKQPLEAVEGDSDCAAAWKGLWAIGQVTVTAHNSVPNQRENRKRIPCMGSYYLEEQSS